jgi:glycosyltransferase involved in cell wall biosynthesis
MEGSKMPTISVITVVYNRIDDLRRTFANVKAQSYPALQYLIIDGGSTDGCAEFCKENEQHLAYWVSEKDNGIYDAMNKSLDASKGDYVLFLNAGDEFFSPTVLEDIFNSIPENTDAIYGETMFMDEHCKDIGLMSEVSTRPFKMMKDWRDMRYGMVFCHQSFLVKRSIAPKYDTEHIFSADIDWIIRCLKEAKTMSAFTKPIARFQLGGFSQKNHLRSLWDRFQILSRHFGVLETIWNHLYLMRRALSKKLSS